MSDYNQRVIDEFRAHGGMVASTGHGRNLVLVHHVGAKSGVERIAPVFAVPDDDGWLIMASKGGAPENPAWYHNLLAHPDTTVEHPAPDGSVQSAAVHVTEAAGEEWEELFARFVERAPGFGAYRERTTRHLPILRLARV